MSQLSSVQRASYARSERDLLWIHRLIWFYFGLLIFEGALRKWIVPSLSNPLLIVRDPVAIAIYALAFRARVFPRNSFMLCGAWLSLVTLIGGLIGSEGAFAVALYGWRTNFLHLPLIFVMARVWTSVQVKQIGHAVLLLSPMLAFLMVLQFRASPDSFLNAGAGEGSRQLDSALGRIRPAATFSFISGPVYFFALSASFLLYAQLSRRAFSPALLGVAACALMSAVVVSGSRSLLGAVALVAACAFVGGVVLQPFLVFRWLWGAAIAVAVASLMRDLPFIQEGFEVLTARIEGAGQAEGGAEGFASRAASDYVSALPLLFEAPLLGQGLGMGTSAGAALLTGRAQFLLAEGEWGRVLIESGPLLGGAFLVWRVCLTLWLGWHAAAHARRRNPLPLLLFGACALGLLNGQLGQPTTLGFAVFVGGLCLCAMRPASQPASVASVASGSTYATPSVSTSSPVAAHVSS